MFYELSSQVFHFNEIKRISNSAQQLVFIANLSSTFEKLRGALTSKDAILIPIFISIHQSL